MIMPSKSRTGAVVVLLLFQGRPLIITDDDGNPSRFNSMKQARYFIARPHTAVDASEAVYILDLATGELDMQ